MGKLDRVKHSTKKYGRRRFSGNRFTKNSSHEGGQEQPQQSQPDKATNLLQTCPNEEFTSKRTPVSFTKVKNIETDTPKKEDPKITGYRIVDVECRSWSGSRSKKTCIFSPNII